MRSDTIPVWGLVMGLGFPALCAAGMATSPPAPPLTSGWQAPAAPTGSALPPGLELAQAPGGPAEEELWEQEDAQTQARTELMGKTVRQVEGQGVHNAQGEQIGSISEIARNRQDRSVAAVISVGGFLGMGATQVAVPLSELRLEGDRVVIATAITEDELKSQPAFEAGQYETLDGGVRLEEAAREREAEVADGPAIRFEDLDDDGDGHISRQEAAGQTQLTEQWGRYDTDRNGRLDEAEFSAFEVESQR